MNFPQMNQLMDGQTTDGTCHEAEATDLSKEDSFVHRSVYYKIFYIFVIGSIFGCYMEQIVYYLQKNIWECRAGVIWGPFSEVYGIGAVLIFLIYKYVRINSPLSVFGLSAACGSMFEYMARLFQELTFHSITWDYSRQPFNLGGRTSLKYSVYWGVLGLIFIKGIFPVMEKKLNQIRGRLAFAFTWVLIIFLSTNMIFSSIAVHRWCERDRGITASNRIEVFMDQYYGDKEMKQLFPHMKFTESSVIN